MFLIEHLDGKGLKMSHVSLMCTTHIFEKTVATAAAATVSCLQRFSKLHSIFFWGLYLYFI